MVIGGLIPRHLELPGKVKAKRQSGTGGQFCRSSLVTGQTERQQNGRKRVFDLSLLGRFRGDVDGQHPMLPSIALTNLNRGSIALELYRIVVLALKSCTPFRVPPYLIASRIYNVRGILIVLWRHGC